MSGDGANDPDVTTITVKIPQSFLHDLDAAWRAEDFSSRSKFIRWTLRDAVEHPTFTRKGWKDIAASEHDMATGEGQIYSSNDIWALLNEDTDGGKRGYVGVEVHGPVETRAREAPATRARAHRLEARRVRRRPVA